MLKSVGKTRCARVRRHSTAARIQAGGYDGLVGGIGALVEEARRLAARRVNAILTVTYWEIGRRIVEHEQQGAAGAEYGQRLLERLARDLTGRYVRGFGAVNLSQMKRFYPLWSSSGIVQTPSEESGARELSKEATVRPSPSGTSAMAQLAAGLVLPWSAYVRLLAVKGEQARQFYEAEAVLRSTGLEITNLLYCDHAVAH